MTTTSPFVRRMNALMGAGAITDTAQIEKRLASMMGVEQARGYVGALQRMNETALGGRARLVLTGGEHATVPGLAMQMGRQSVMLPVYNQESRLGSWGSQSYAMRGMGTIGPDGTISRMSAMDWFTGRVNGIKGNSVDQSFRALKKASTSLQTKLGFHFRNQAGGGGSPLFRGDMYRIAAPEGTELGTLAREVAFQRKRAVAGIEGINPSNLTANQRLVAFDAMEKAHKAQGQIMEILTKQGFSGASKVTVNSKGTVIRAGTIPGAMYGTNFLYRPEKGPHHQAEREILLAEKLYNRPFRGRTMPYMLPETASEYMSVARGVANMRGISASSQVLLDAPIRLAGLMPREGLGGEQLGRVEAMLQTMLGDSGVLGAGRHAQSIVNQGFAYTTREQVLTGVMHGGNSEWALGEHLGQFAGKPGIYNVNITAEEVVKANRSKLSGLSKAQAMELERNLGTVGQSLTTTGAAGRAIKLGKNEAITRVLVNQDSMRLIIGRKHLSSTNTKQGVGARMIMGGETRMTMAANIGKLGRGGGYADFVAKLGAGGIPIRQLMLHNMAAKLSGTSKDGVHIGKDMMDIMSNILGGKTQELAPGQFSVGFGKGALDGRPVADIVKDLGTQLQNRFGNTGFKYNGKIQTLGQLLTPDIGRLDKDTAQLLAQRLPAEQRPEAVRMLMEDVSRADFVTTAAMRASQPGRGGAINFRMQKLNLLAHQLGFGEGLFGADESTTGMSGPAAKAAGIRNQARGWWRDFVAPRDPRNKSIRGLMGDFVQWGRGDAALVEHLQAQGRMGDIWSLERFQKTFAIPSKTTGRIQPNQTGGYVFKKDRNGRLVPTKRSIILDLGADRPQALGADAGLNRRYAILPSGMAMGARAEHELFANKGTAAGRMLRAQLNLAQAAASGAPVEEIAQAAGAVNASIGERILGKHGWVNRQIMSGVSGSQMAMVPDATLAPGEIGITKRTAKALGLDRSMIDRAKKSGIYGLTSTDPAFSGVHAQLNRIRVIRRKGADKYAAFIHPGEAAARYRDFDADVLGLFVSTNRKQNQALKAMFEHTGAAGSALMARQSYQALLEASGRKAQTGFKSWSEKVNAPSTAAEIEGALVKDMTATGTRVPYTLLRPYKDITQNVLMAVDQGSGSALWGQMGLHESQLSQQHVRKSIDRMIAAKQASGGQLMEAMTAAERIVYGTLNKKKAGDRGGELAERIAQGLLSYRNLPEGEFEAHSQKVGTMIEELVSTHPRYNNFKAGMGAEVSAAMGSAVRLAEHAGARSPIAAFVAAGVGVQRGAGPLPALMAQANGMVGQALGVGQGVGVPAGQVHMGPGLYGRIGEVGRQAAEAGQRAGPAHMISETAKNLAESGKNLVGRLLKSKGGKFALGVAGAAAVMNLMGRGGGSDSGGAPMPPEPMVQVQQDPGLQEFSQQKIQQARVERVPGVRTHAQVTVRSSERGPDMTRLGSDAFGRFGARVVQSGTFSDDMAPVEYRHQMEREIHRRMNSSF